jgi:hypothetical protein
MIKNFFLHSQEMRSSKKKPSDFLQELPPFPKVNFKVNIYFFVLFFATICVRHLQYIILVREGNVIFSFHYYCKSVAHILHFRCSRCILPNAD